MPHLSVSRLLLPGAVVLILNSAYLVAAPTASLWYYANVVAHPLLGIALALAVAPRVVRREWAVGPLAVAGAGVVGVGLLLGLVVLVRGATRQYEPILYAHIATSVAGAALLVVDTWRRATGAASRVWAVRGALVAIVAAGVAAPIVRTLLDDKWQQAYRIENPIRTPTSMEEEGAEPTSPFFPSSADTNTGDLIPSEFFLTSETCGRCHADIYDQWSSSAHHFSSFNNQWYRKSIEYMQDVVGTQPSKWCAGCHDHAVSSTGGSTSRPVSRSTRQRRKQVSGVHRVTRSCTWGARWGRATS